VVVQAPSSSAVTVATNAPPIETSTRASGAAVPRTVTGVVEDGSATVMVLSSAGAVILSAGAAVTENARRTTALVESPIVCVTRAVWTPTETRWSVVDQVPSASTVAVAVRPSPASTSIVAPA
jgi:hypothetical protein